MVTSNAVTVLRADIAEWLNDGEVTMEMLERALEAKSLESLVIEGDALIYVRSGEKIATYNAATGELVDDRLSLTVATVDATNGLIYPAA